MLKQNKDQLSEIQNLTKQNLRYVKSIHESTPKNSSGKESDNKKILKEILQYTQASYAILEKVKRWIFWNRILSIFKILIIVIPLVLGFIYLPSLLENVVGPYKELLDQANVLGQGNIFDQLKNLQQ